MTHQFQFRGPGFPVCHGKSQRLAGYEPAPHQ
jgi:hypothetical protein